MNTPLNPLSRGEVFFIAIQIRKLVKIKFKALKERQIIALGAAQQTRGIEDRNNHRRTEDSFKTMNKYEAVWLRVRFGYQSNVLG